MPRELALLLPLLLAACPNYTSVTVQARNQRFVVLRNTRAHCAVHFFDGYGDGGSETARYEAFFQADGSGDFTRRNVVHTLGEVSEKLTPDPEHGPDMVKASGNPFVFCGNLTIPWSPSNHLYLDGPYGAAKFELAETPWTSSEQIDVHDPKLTWVGPRSHCLCEWLFAKY